jgi:succinoglycan biosynthesis protein ExoL
MHLLGVVATIGRTVPLFRDVADLPRLLSSTNAKAALARRFDAWSARRAAGLVVTSEAFYDDYYRPMLGSGAPRCFVLANNVDPEVTGPRIAAPFFSQDRPLRIGYFGLIRCERSLEILAAVARLAPEGVKVLVRGHNLIGFDLDQLAADLPNFEVGSQYRSPEDLASVYAACDVVWSCYPYEPANINWRLAKTNRFYEACYFRRPQICQAGTKDAKKVIELGIGISVDLADVAGSAAAIAAITRNQLAYMADRLEQLPADVYTYSGEAGEIAAFAKRVVTIPR